MHRLMEKDCPHTQRENERMKGEREREWRGERGGRGRVGGRIERQRGGGEGVME